MMITTGLIGISIFIGILTFFSLYRAYVGPTAADRVISINVITTKVTVLIAIISVITDQDTFIDVGLIYSMIGFLTTISISKYIQKGKLY